MGCDDWSEQQRSIKCVRFNSRTPCGVRPESRSNKQWRRMFQFTHPVWGATSRELDVARPKDVSIHAPRVGCDQEKRQESSTIKRFNSRTPCGVRLTDESTADGRLMFQFTHPVWGATPSASCDAFGLVFQFTHPVWGATTEASQRCRCLGVSIHAPRVGCDLSVYHKDTHLMCFNSRTPCGVRPDLSRAVCSPDSFQFTHPVWGAT